MKDADIHMIGNTHIDPVWLWKQAEGMQEVKSSFMSVLDRMNEFPDFKFTMSSISYLEWVKENCPELFEGIKVRVAEGRWEIAGAMWVEPDCIMPTGESLIRHILFSKEFTREYLSLEPVIGYNVDSFGHSSNLPAILTGCGMKYYIFNRPCRKWLDIPPVFTWKSPDGSSVIAERIGGEYLAWTKPGIEFNLKESKEALDLYDYSRMAVFYGVGNHGGGPTIDNIKSIYELREEYQGKLDFSTLKEFFEKVEPDKIPTFEGELGRIFTGCYSSDNEIKRLNRKAEWSLIKAEAVSAMAARISVNRYHYPKEEMERAWKKTLFNQFHDVLSGTSIESARNEACHDFSYSISTANTIISNGIQWIANSIDTRGDGFPLVLVNPTGHDFKGVFYADVYEPAAKRKQVRMRGLNGDEIPYQELPCSYYARDARKRILFEAEVPGFGYSVYRVLQEGPDFKHPVNQMQVDNNTISNNILAVTIDKVTGCPSSIKKNGIELLADPTSFQVFYDDRGAWGVEHLEEKLEGVFQAESVRVIETNFLRTIIRSILTFRNSELVVDYILEKDKDTIQMNCTIHNHEKHVQICYSMPIAGEEHKVFTETAYFVDDKVVKDGTEFYQQRFADVVNKNQQGVAIINNCAYGLSQKDNVYRLILSRSVMFARGDGGPLEMKPDIRVMDQGCWDFSLVLLPHTEALDKKRLFCEADFLHMPVEYLGDNNHKGSRRLRKDSIVNISGNGIHAGCYKPAQMECGSEIIRIFESEGRDTMAQITIGELVWNTELAPYQMKTILIKGNEITECNLIEQIIMN